jgi:serine/threonine protein kinase
VAVPENQKTESHSDQFDEMVSEFSRLVREGKSPDIDEFASRNEALASRVQRLFPVLEMMELRGESREWSEIELTKLAEATQSPRDEKWKAPQRIGDFRMIRQIGRGGMGVVYEAEQESLGRRVAIKILPTSAQFDERRMERFATEARASAMLHHTNIVPVFGVGSEEGLSFFVMQYIDGQPLSHVLRDVARYRDISTRKLEQDGATYPSQGIVGTMLGESISGEKQGTDDSDKRSLNLDSTDSDVPSAAADLDAVFSPSSGSGRLMQSDDGESSGNRARNYFRNAARIGAKVADALEHAHSHGILHRDIKPSNLLLDEQGSVWVTDFGLAKYFDSPDITRTGEIIGTLRYMSPEQLEGDATPSSDIFGLGLTLYEMLTLQPAYPGVDRKRLFEKVTQANPANPRSIDSRIPRDFETIVMKCIQSDPAKRYASAAEVGEDLTRFLDGEPIQARRINQLEKAWKWCCRRPTLAVSLAALLMSILLGIAGVTWQWRKAELALADSESNLVKATVATEEARRATESANENYTLARSAVVQLTESISNEELLTSPNLLPVRRKLLLKALDYQIRFSKNKPDDIDIKFELADAYVNLALVCSELNRTDEAKQHLQESRKLLESLLKRQPAGIERERALICLSESLAIEGDMGLRISPDNQFFLFKSVDVLLDGREETELSDTELLKLAELHWRVGEAFNLQNIARGKPIRTVTQLAKERFTKAYNLIESISSKDANESHVCDLADLHRDLGSVNRRLKLNNRAFEHYSASVDQFRELVESDPDNTEFRFGLAQSLSSMAFYHDFANRDPETSQKFYKESLERYRELSDQYPTVLKFSMGESNVMMNYCLLLERNDRSKEAALIRERVLQLCERTQLLANDEPNVLSNYGKALMQMGRNQLKLGDQETAMRFYAKARAKHLEAVKKAPLNPTYEIRHVRVITNMSFLLQAQGKFDEAFEMLVEPAKDDNPEAEVMYLLGRALLKLVGKIESSEVANENDQETARQAIDLAKYVFRLGVGPKVGVRERLESDKRLTQFRASESGVAFMGWFSDAQNRFSEKRKSLKKR